MNATLLCVAILVPGYGEKDIVQRVMAAGGTVRATPDGRAVCVALPQAAGDTDLVDLCELRHLDRLSLVETKVTDNGLRTASGWRGLSELCLFGTAISDEGLRHLEALKGLRVLNLQYCPRITDAGVAQLQKALPNCKIHR
jgi:hypothetical protein